MFGDVGTSSALGWAPALKIIRMIQEFCKGILLSAAMMTLIAAGCSVVACGNAEVASGPPRLVANPRYPADVGSLCRDADQREDSGWVCQDGVWRTDMDANLRPHPALVPDPYDVKWPDGKLPAEIVIHPRHDPVPDESVEVFRKGLLQDD